MGNAPLSWEVLNGVGVDGVGGNFPFFSFFFVFLRFFVFFRFSSFFFVFFRFSSLFFAFLRFSWNEGKRLQFTGKMGNFTPTPSAPTPFGTSRLRPENGPLRRRNGPLRPWCWLAFQSAA